MAGNRKVSYSREAISQNFAYSPFKTLSKIRIVDDSCTVLAFRALGVLAVSCGLLAFGC